MPNARRALSIGFGLGYVCFIKVCGDGEFSPRFMPAMTQLRLNAAATLSSPDCKLAYVQSR